MAGASAKLLQPRDALLLAQVCVCLRLTGFRSTADAGCASGRGRQSCSRRQHAWAPVAYEASKRVAIKPIAILNEMYRPRGLLRREGANEARGYSVCSPREWRPGIVPASRRPWPICVLHVLQHHTLGVEVGAVYRDGRAHDAGIVGGPAIEHRENREFQFVVKRNGLG